LCTPLNHVIIYMTCLASHSTYLPDPPYRSLNRQFGMLSTGQMSKLVLQRQRSNGCNYKIYEPSLAYLAHLTVFYISHNEMMQYYHCIMHGERNDSMKNDIVI